MENLNVELYHNEENKNSSNMVQINESPYSTYDGCCMVFISILLLPTVIGTIFICYGLFQLQPNQAAIITLFGKYKGTVREAGYHFINPFACYSIVSLKQQNLDGKTIYVNDKRGNPIEIAIVVVWRIVRPVDAIFQVENYLSYVYLQSEAALRQLATSFSYDHAGNEDEITLLNGGDKVNNFLVKELNERLIATGIVVDEARLNHLMYAKEITTTMLKRQQADAQVAARKKIVEGATGIVRGTINNLSKDIQFSEENKAAMASNLILVLCSETQTQPIMHLNKIEG